jgi:hypothetical protein
MVTNKQVAQKNKKVKDFITFSKLIINLSAFVVVALGLMLLTNLYVVSEAPQGIFRIFWFIGTIAIMIKTLTINFASLGWK